MNPRVSQAYKIIAAPAGVHDAATVSAAHALIAKAIRASYRTDDGYGGDCDGSQDWNELAMREQARA
jgi:hypothetical protein